MTSSHSTTISPPERALFFQGASTGRTSKVLGAPCNPVATTLPY